MLRLKRSEPSSWSRRIGLVVMGVATLGMPARANAEVEAIRLLYEGTRACPSEAEFVTRVRAYTRRWTLEEDATRSTREIRVRGGAEHVRRKRQGAALERRRARRG